ncbi:MAG: hypothetical protein HWD92_12460 [Flavobacteriia bacterium]|nr:hypothetical protein [Flavobacteriia bacterium]
MSTRAPLRNSLSLIVLFLVCTGLITQFNFNGDLDINIHDTYIVLDHSLVVVGLAFGVLIVHLIGLGIRMLNNKSSDRRILALWITRLCILGALILAAGLSIFIHIPTAEETITSSLGLPIYFTGIALYFIALAAGIRKKMRRRRRRRSRENA